MKKITYKTLKIQNFLSVGNEPITIEFQQGINQIDGRNIDEPERKNAVGKSVVMSAHFFALFGETVNKIKNEFIVNNVTNGKGLVEETFDVETDGGIKSYTVRRQVKPSKVELFCGDVDITKDSIANTNKYICDLLQTNPTIHRCCDIMTVRDTTPFMSMDAADKRKFIEDIFSINVFGVMLKDLKKMISENKTDTSISSAKLQEIEKSLELLLEQKETIRIQIQEREAVLQKRKDDLDLKMEDIEDKIKNVVITDTSKLKTQVNKCSDVLLELDKKSTVLSMKMGGMASDKRAHEHELKRASQIDGSFQCEKCLQDIPKSHLEHLEILKKEKEEAIRLIEIDLQNGLDEQKTLQSNIAKVREKMGEIEEKIREVEREVERLKSLNDTLFQYTRSREELDEDINSSTTSIDSFDVNIDKMKIRNKEESDKLFVLKQTADDLETCKFILGEEGVKSFVVKKLLVLLNNTIEKYLVRLGLSVRCKFDEYFDEVIVNGKGKVFSYKNASGAEKKSLDFACAMSFSDMRRKINGVSTNVEIIDEAMDTALDSTGILLLLDVLRERAETNDTCLYIISHRKEVPPHITGETVMLQKENGVTKRVA